MKKSPLSRFQDSGNNFRNRGRGHWSRNKNYSYKNRNDNESFQSFGNSQESPDVNSHKPLDASTPICQQNRENWRFSDNKNRRGNFQGSPNFYSPYNKFGHHNNSYKQNKNFDPRSYREFDVSRMFNIDEIFRDPWADLEKKFNANKSECSKKTIILDSSVEILSEASTTNFDSSTDSVIIDNGTINISSSADENNAGSSVDLPIDSIKFGSSSKESNLKNNSITSESDSSSSINKSLEESVEIVYNNCK